MTLYRKVLPTIKFVIQIISWYHVFKMFYNIFKMLYGGIRSTIKFFTKKRTKKTRWRDQKLEHMGDELIKEFIANGYSEREGKLARNIRIFIEDNFKK